MTDQHESKRGITAKEREAAELNFIQDFQEFVVRLTVPSWLQKWQETLLMDDSSVNF
jgi:hypothetical protein